MSISSDAISNLSGIQVIIWISKVRTILFNQNQLLRILQHLNRVGGQNFLVKMILYEHDLFSMFYFVSLDTGITNLILELCEGREAASRLLLLQGWETYKYRTLLRQQVVYPNLHSLPPYHI